MAKPMPEAPTMWLTNVQGENLDESISKVAELGGQICVPTIPTPAWATSPSSRIPQVAPSGSGRASRRSSGSSHIPNRGRAC